MKAVKAAVLFALLANVQFASAKCWLRSLDLTRLPNGNIQVSITHLGNSQGRLDTAILGNPKGYSDQEFAQMLHLADANKDAHSAVVFTTAALATGAATAYLGPIALVLAVGGGAIAMYVERDVMDDFAGIGNLKSIDQLMDTDFKDNAEKADIHVISDSDRNKIAIVQIDRRQARRSTKNSAANIKKCVLQDSALALSEMLANFDKFNAGLKPQSDENYTAVNNGFSGVR